MLEETHSKKYNNIKRYYNTFKDDGNRVWNIGMVKNAVEKSWITAEEFEQITEEKYR